MRRCTLSERTTDEGTSNVLEIAPDSEAPTTPPKISRRRVLSAGAAAGVTAGAALAGQDYVKPAIRSLLIPTVLAQSGPGVPPGGGATTCTVSVPLLASKAGFRFIITTTAAGPISATWTFTGPVRNVQLEVYAGTPFPASPNPSTANPAGGNLIASQNLPNSNGGAVATASQPAGQYTVYFFNNEGTDANTVPASTGTVTFIGACP